MDERFQQRYLFSHLEFHLYFIDDVAFLIFQGILSQANNTLATLDSKTTHLAPKLHRCFVLLHTSFRSSTAPIQKYFELR